MRLRSLLGLGLAGICTAALGGGVLAAHAEVRAFEVTLADGRVLLLTVDVPPGTEIWQIDFPEVDEAQIVAIEETVPEETAPAPPTKTDPQGPVEGEGPRVAPPEEPALREGGRPQRTTGSKQRDRDARARRRRDRDRARAGERRSSRLGEEGLPTLNDPTTSIAVPGPAPIGVPNFFIDKFRIPPFLLSIYQAAGIEYGVRWEVLAAINEIETDYGRNLNVSSAGAVGWMQFMPATWKQYGVDANGDRKKDPYNPVDAIFAAARYLRAAGAETDLRRAIFAYNHADWYVDSVLMRARLIGGLPTDLVGSLTGLTQGRFPVAARARYAGDVDAREAQRRVAKGTNAAQPIESDTRRRDVRIYARPGSPVIAVQDGRIVDRGRSREHGRYVVLRDAFGNTYTYSHLGSLARLHPVLRERPAVLRAGMYANPPRDPVPTRAASAGTQREAPSRRPEPAPRPRMLKERLFADPARAGAQLGGADRQLAMAPSQADLDLLGLPRSQVRMKRLRIGSRVIGGTVLGRIDRTSREQAPHVAFAIRPAGRGAPRIDPKPILDGWKLLESTAIYRARRTNPFFGPDARTPSIGQILLMGKPELERRVLANPRIEIYDCGRRDVRASRIDRRVLATLEFLAASGLRPTVTSLTCGHSYYTASGNVSHHTTGSAVDIAKVNGIPVLGHQGPGSVTDLTVRRLLTLQGTMKPAQIISLMEYEGTDNTLAMGDHDDHIHVGFTPLGGTKAGRQLAAVLKPGQWVKLIDRLGEIDNPTVSAKPSRDAITVVPSRRGRGGD
ncbi:MAG TPA: lytic murein transglycosylase [Solirubrobacteraceae bacterium]|nr:lytic murein transglycosylase [Solirubrobacteraceae bacterium]